MAEYIGKHLVAKQLPEEIIKINSLNYEILRYELYYDPINKKCYTKTKLKGLSRTHPYELITKNTIRMNQKSWDVAKMREFMEEGLYNVNEPRKVPKRTLGIICSSLIFPQASITFKGT